ncbi:hypothetical protein [Deinococcus kurensis]|uniref:hypothetical protein n=1 Tax=Deinococcus kurensis TaxID=2662757 RepID=UPI0012D2CC70|nr:hypothetical protein [Deinococcus kurensis]
MIVLGSEVLNVMRDAGFTVQALPANALLNDPSGSVRYRVSRPGWATFDCYAGLRGGMAMGARLNDAEALVGKPQITGGLATNVYYEDTLDVQCGPSAVSVASRWRNPQPYAVNHEAIRVPLALMVTAQRVLDGNGDMVPGATLLTELRTFLLVSNYRSSNRMVVARALYLGPSGESRMLRGWFLTNGTHARSFRGISQTLGGHYEIERPPEWERLRDGAGGSVVMGPLWTGWNQDPVGLPQQLLTVAHADVANETQNGLTMRAGTREHLLTRVNVPYLPDGLKVFLGYGA